ncbi:MAG: U32 family peptidase [Armatimonadetes bacterium]|nr:U32 family peptidase [Armatimonadota bacterium]
MIPELLAPAGNLERLKWAVAYGADAVYFGITDFSLRSFAGNFTLADAREGLGYLHKNGRKGYVTLNIYPFSNEYDELMRTAIALDEMGSDAFIISDLGVIRELRNLKLRTPIHVSTQANTTSHQAVLAYRDFGAKRVNLARELSFEQILEIQSNLEGEGVETEVFIHGSVCFSYSGRCAISDYLTGRMANRGDCTQPCRWQYTLEEEKRPGEHFPVFEDERGLYFFNSRDLALFEFVPRLAEAGVASIKLEGRMKNIHYIAAAVSVYRAILDGKPISEADAWEQLGRVNNRGFSHGFMKGNITAQDYAVNDAKYQSTSIMMANTTEQMHDGHRVCVVKNTIRSGETLEMLTTDGISSYTLPNPIINIDGEPLERANNQDTILLDGTMPSYAVLRRVEPKTSCS